MTTIFSTVTSTTRWTGTSGTTPAQSTVNLVQGNGRYGVYLWSRQFVTHGNKPLYAFEGGPRANRTVGPYKNTSAHVHPLSRALLSYMAKGKTDPMTLTAYQGLGGADTHPGSGTISEGTPVATIGVKINILEALAREKTLRQTKDEGPKKDAPQGRGEHGEGGVAVYAHTITLTNTCTHIEPGSGIPRLGEGPGTQKGVKRGK